MTPLLLSNHMLITMRSALLVAIAAVVNTSTALAFTAPTNVNTVIWPLSAQTLPTVEELGTDGFMKQLQHSQRIVPLLSSNSAGAHANIDVDIVDRLKAQLKHSDGIRGFFVTYLTLEGDQTTADQDAVPKALLTAMKECDNQTEIISLACMNVVMPTGMITMHTDKELSRRSHKTAERGERVLKALSEQNPLVTEECKAILAVASGSAVDDRVDSAKVAFWKEFFIKWGYQDIQKRDIAQAMESILA